MRPAFGVEFNPRGPTRKERPSQCNGQRQATPAFCSDGMDEFDWQKHCNRQKRDQPQNNPIIRAKREQNDHQHIPAAGKPKKTVVFGFHIAVAKLDGR